MPVRASCKLSRAVHTQSVITVMTSVPCYLNYRVGTLAINMFKGNLAEIQICF